MAEGGRFESGVYGYVKAQCVITVYFPIDKKGNADISCRQCPYYRQQSRTCGLNESIVAFGDKYVGANCPLRASIESNIADAAAELYGDEDL